MDDKYIAISCAYLDLKSAMDLAQVYKHDYLAARFERTLEDLADAFSEYDLPCLNTVHSANPGTQPEY